MMNSKTLWFLNCLLLILACHHSITGNNEVVRSEIKECRVYNWENMTCYWNRYYVDGEEVTTTLWYERHLGPCNISYRFYPNQQCHSLSKNKTHNMCHFTKSEDVRFTFYMISHCIYLKSSNTSLVANSEMYAFRDLWDIVEPNPVSSIQVLNLTSSHVSLIWTPPKNRRKIFNYLINYSHDGYDWHSLNRMNRSVELDDLIPYTEYKISITCSSIEQNQTKGFWSKPAVVYFKTLQNVPAAAPSVHYGRYKFMDWNVTKITWQAIPQRLRNGELIMTRIRIVTLLGFRFFENLLKGNESDTFSFSEVNNSYDATQTFNTSSNEVLLELDPMESHLVFVDQGTSVGFNESITPRPIIVPDRRKVPSNIKVYNATTNKDNLFQFSWKKLPDALSYSIYWCLADLKHKCITSYEQEEIPGDSTHYEKYLKPNNKYKWLFSTSSEFKISGRIVSSGMRSINCIYNTSRVLIKSPQNFYYDSSNPNGLTLKWDHPSCHFDYPAYFSHYVISYCSLPHCKDRKHKTILRDENKITFEDLIKSQLYNFSIQSSLTDSASPKSSHLVVDIPSVLPDWHGFVLPIMGFCVLLFLFLSFVIFGLKKYHEPIEILPPECKQQNIPDDYQHL